jgi:hypothetical protein
MLKPRSYKGIAMIIEKYDTMSLIFVNLIVNGPDFTNIISAYCMDLIADYEVE